MGATNGEVAGCSLKNEELKHHMTLNVRFVVHHMISIWLQNNMCYRLIR